MLIFNLICLAIRLFMSRDGKPVPQDEPVSGRSVEEKLDDLAAGHDEELDWRRSVVDLMKVVGLDSGLQARRKLAKEMGFQGRFEGRPDQNEWLHDVLIGELANHGIELPMNTKEKA